MKKFLIIITFLLMILTGCKEEEKEVREELEKLGMNKQEQDATLEAVGIHTEDDSIQTEDINEEENVHSYSVIEQSVPFGGDAFSEIAGGDADVYYEDNKTLISFRVENEQRYYISVLENGKWVKKDQPYITFEQGGFNWEMKKNYLYGKKIISDNRYDNFVPLISDMIIYEDKFMKEGTSKEIPLNEFKFSSYKIISSDKGPIIVLGDFENYILPKDGVMKSFNINQENFKNGNNSDCDYNTINFQENDLYCSYFGTSESKISKYNLDVNEWEYTEDGADIKKTIVDEAGKIVANTKGVMGSISLVDVYGGKDYLVFQAFDHDINPIGDKVNLDIPVSNNMNIGDIAFTIETENDNFVVWYQYSFKGKPAIAKYVISQ